MILQNQERVVLSNIQPQIEGGSYAVKRIVGQQLTVTADILCDGHDHIQANLLYKHESNRKWKEVRMQAVGNDQMIGSFTVEQKGNYQYKIEGWVDEALNWLSGIEKKIQANLTVTSELLEGALYIKRLLKTKSITEADKLQELIGIMEDENSYDKAIEAVLDPKLKILFVKHPTQFLKASSTEFPLYVDRKKALFSTWYEFFPRSAGTTPGIHGTFKDCEKLLPRIAKLEFDTLYFPPVHPIGELNRKGKNNATTAVEGDVGSPWGIGSQYGGHKDLHPELGTLADFKSLVKKANQFGIEIAMDFALQAAPDHPWVKTHPQWFKWRPDGSIQYAENPPKKYQDILPIYFETEDWKSLWEELLSCALYWVEEVGIKTFRVDNPHTKPFRFWNWLIAQVKKKHPDVLFLAEAFTRPKIMDQLAKEGFTQGYSYFTWRFSKFELTEYMEELTKGPQKEFYRPNFWPNTPDINPYHLQGANEAQHLSRYFLAATLSSNVGIYGPVFEFMESEAIPGKEEYYNSEKYECRNWDWEAENKIMVLIKKINQARKALPSLQQTNHIEFCEIHNDNLIGYMKKDEQNSCFTIMIVSLDSYYTQEGSVKLPLSKIGLDQHTSFAVTDQITGNQYQWGTEWNYVKIHPSLPFHLFKLSI
jgi:starch synthase (maltosyl-transferring)